MLICVSRLNLCSCFCSNNAGIMACPFLLSSDNIELQFATNHLGMFSLEELMISSLFASLFELLLHRLKYDEEHFLCYKVYVLYNASGHFLLANLLLERMKKTASESNREGRIVIVSSEGHRFAYREGVQFDKINDEAR